VKFRITDAWPSSLDLDPDVVDAVFDRARLADALAALANKIDTDKTDPEKINTEEET